jgi:rod shape-determining protein MreC
MRHTNSKFLSGLLAGVVILIMLNVFWFHWFRPQTTIGSAWSAALFNDSSRLHGFISALTNWRNLASENEDLKAKLQDKTASMAVAGQLQRENEQLRLALGLAAKTKQTIIPASIYNISLAPDGYTALINKGANNQVIVGNIVIGEHNILVGTVQAVFPNSARVVLISDPSFKVTVLVMGGQTKGIAHGVLDKGMILDLVVQGDEIKDGDTLISSGDDMIPGGLIVGTVSHVESNNAKLFKQVNIIPAAHFITGNIFILK